MQLFKSRYVLLVRAKQRNGCASYLPDRKTNLSNLFYRMQTPLSSSSYLPNITMIPLPSQDVLFLRAAQNLWQVMRQQERTIEQTSFRNKTWRLKTAVRNSQTTSRTVVSAALLVLSNKNNTAENNFENVIIEQVEGGLKKVLTHLNVVNKVC
jgi:hypothetical protein